MNYPNDFYNYEGVPVRDEKIQDWIDLLIEDDIKNSYIHSGNAIVIKMGKDIIVAKDYKMGIRNIDDIQ